jgi:hypothetical protein
MTDSPPTLNDLLAPLEGRVTTWAEALGLDPRTIWRLRKGLVSRPHKGTVALIAAGLQVKREVVQQAIKASYEQAQREG